MAPSCLAGLIVLTSPILSTEGSAAMAESRRKQLFRSEGGPVAVEPAPDAARAECNFVGGQDGRWALESSVGRLSSQECDFDLGDLVVPEFEVADALSVVS
jgi:hypothetical protein